MEQNIDKLNKLEGDIVVIESRIEELSTRKKLFLDFTERTANRLKFLKKSAVERNEFNQFVEAKDFKSKDYVNFRLRGFKNRFILDSQIQEEYVLDSLKFIQVQLNAIDVIFSNRGANQMEASVFEDFEHQFDNLNRQTLFKTLLYESYSYLEAKMKELCELMQSRSAQTLKKFAKGKQTSYLNIYLQYLVENTLENHANILAIEPYRLLRNYLTHESNAPTTTTAKIEIICAANQNLQIIDGVVLISNRIYILNLIADVHKYLNTVIDKMLE